MEIVLFFATLGLVSGCSFTLALVTARLAIRAVFALAGVRDAGPRI